MRALQKVGVAVTAALLFLSAACGSDNEPTSTSQSASTNDGDQPKTVKATVNKPFIEVIAELDGSPKLNTTFNGPCSEKPSQDENCHPRRGDTVNIVCWEAQFHRFAILVNDVLQPSHRGDIDEWTIEGNQPIGYIFEDDVENFEGLRKHERCSGKVLTRIPPK